MPVTVTTFDLGWHGPANQGWVGMRFSDGKSNRLKVTSLADLAGWAALLRDGPVVLTPNGWLHTTNATRRNLIEDSDLTSPFSEPGDSVPGA